jgi:hypothetical protein
VAKNSIPTFHVVMRPMKGQSKKVKVTFYSGYKGKEIPRSVTFGNEELPIKKIIERKRILDHKTGKEREEFKIELKDKTAILKITNCRECEITFLLS